MAIFDFLRKKPQKEEINITPEERGLSLALGFNNISSFASSQTLRLSAVYAATNMISNSVALLPMKIITEEGGRRREIEHPLYKVLNLKPNAKYNHFNFMKLLIESLILKGNGYAYIERDENLNVKALHLIDADFVTPVLQGDGSVKYVVNGMSQAVDAINMIHLYQHLDNTHRGISAIKYADMALHGAYNAEVHSNNFFKSGAGLMGVLKASAPLTNDQKRQVAESWKLSISNTQGGGIAVLPQGLDYQSISISPEDSQLLETRKYNVVEIARFLNISPTKLFDYSNVSYSTLEQTSLSYLQDTILPYTQLLEDEINLKLFKPSEVGRIMVDFDYSVLVQTDKNTEGEYYTKLLLNGVLSVNDVRARLGFEPTNEVGADKHWMQISYATIENIASGAYIKQTEQTQGQKVDNKVKQDEAEETEQPKPKKKTKKATEE
jgi:HK97 family phage portal protein